MRGRPDRARGDAIPELTVAKNDARSIGIGFVGAGMAG
jgi:hypothetical protein